MLFSASAVTITGEPRYYTVTGESGKKIRRGFSMGIPIADTARHERSLSPYERYRAGPLRCAGDLVMMRFHIQVKLFRRVAISLLPGERAEPTLV
jgi:hypothetical protein